METLSRIMMRAYSENRNSAPPVDLEQLKLDLQYVAGLGPEEAADFLSLSDSNHVLVRAFTILQNAAIALGNKHIADWCEQSLSDERTRIDRCVDKLKDVCDMLESHRCQATVIKSLDHWPDLGSDVDLYTNAEPSEVERLMKNQFGARPVERSWGDRLANKWNFAVPGIPELVEIHFQYLGQTGEHAAVAKRVVERRVKKEVAAHVFYVPAPEERIVISALQRVYRHFYFRLCDMIDIALLTQRESINFEELRRAAELAGIWPGVATFLSLIQSYIRSYGGDLRLPNEVVASAYRAGDTVHFGEGFLRVSKLTAAELYGAQLMQAGRRRDTRALLRLPLLPPLAISALVAHTLTGNDKGIW